VVEIRQSQQWGKYLESLGWVSCGAIRIRKLLFFSLIKYQRPPQLNKTDLSKLKQLARKHKALFVKVEPVDNKQARFLESNGFKKDRWPLLAPKTIVIDITLSLEEIKASFKKDARYCLRRAEQNKLEAAVSKNPAHKDLLQFYALWKKTGKRGKFYVPSKKELFAKAKAFEDKCFLVQIKDMAGAFCGAHGQTCYYFHAASSLKGQKLHAPYLCLWEVIKFAKKEGCRVLDLEGIYDERFKSMTKKWRGFTVFKKKWGGMVVEFPGAYTKFTWFGLR